MGPPHRDQRGAQGESAQQAARGAARCRSAGAVDGEELFFLHYVGHATGPNGPIEIRGLDRVRTRDGVVVENVIRYDPVFVTQT